MKRLPWLFLVVLIFIFIPNKTLAQDIAIPYSVNLLKFSINVQKDTQYQIQEQFQFSDYAPENFSWVINSDSISELNIFQNNILIPSSQYSLQKNNGKILILNLKNYNYTNNWQISWTQNGEITPFENIDEFRFQPIEQFGFYINKLEIDISFPEILDQKQIEPIFYAIHGIESTNVSILNSGIVKYSASNLSPYASYTSVIYLPKGVLEISPIAEFLEKINLLGFNFWLGIIFAFPFIAFLIIFIMVSIKRKQENIKIPDKILKHRPAQLSAPLIGVLFRQKIGPREIASILLDLAIKGYLIINEREVGYSFGERRDFKNLRPFQKAVADELLKGGLRESLFNIQQQPKKELFSESVNQIYNDIYSDISKLGYFVRDPKIVSLKYKFFGIILFFASVIGFFFAPIIFPEAQYIIFAFLGVTIASLVIISLADTMPKRTKKGQKALEDWLAFRKYLIEFSESVGFKQVQQDVFLKYLPYAVVLGVERDWADHFTRVPMKVPDWYNSFRTINTLSQFTQGFYPLIDDICKVVVSLKEPIL